MTRNGEARNYHETKPILAWVRVTFVLFRGSYTCPLYSVHHDDKAAIFATKWKMKNGK